MNTSFESRQKQRQALRHSIKAKRLLLSEAQQQANAQRIVPEALSLIDHYQTQHIAFYLPFNGEISPLVLIDTLLAQGKSIYLPVIHPFSKGNLLFLQYDKNTPFVQHAFGMNEPKLDVRKVLPLSELDMIFTPLVACDKQGNRLGYGGGFYDRTLAYAPQAVSVGLAHSCQIVENLPLESWDMPLNHLIIGN